MQAVQGLLNYAPNGPKDGGLMLMKGSSKLFNEFFSQERTEADHVSRFSEVLSSCHPLPHNSLNPSPPTPPLSVVWALNVLKYVS